MEKAMAPHSSTLAWKIPWMEEPGRLQSMGSQRVGHNWATSLSLFTFMHWRRKWQPTPVFLPGESQGRGSLVGCHLWGRQSQTRLKRLSSSSIDLKGLIMQRWWSAAWDAGHLRRHSLALRDCCATFHSPLEPIINTWTEALVAPEKWEESGSAASLWPLFVTAVLGLREIETSQA